MSVITPVTHELMTTYRQACQDRFEEKELKRMHKAFYSASPSGSMDTTMFKEYIRALGVFPYTTLSDTFPHLFRGYDVDGDGSVSMIDFIQYHTAIVFSDGELLQRIVFAMYDADKNGVITKDEFTTVIKEATRLCGDTDVTTSTVQMLIDQEVGRLMGLLDVDRDGQVSREELRLVSERHPEVLEKLRSLA